MTGSTAEKNNGSMNLTRYTGKPELRYKELFAEDDHFFFVLWPVSLYIFFLINVHEWSFMVDSVFFSPSLPFRHFNSFIFFPQLHSITICALRPTKKSMPLSPPWHSHSPTDINLCLLFCRVSIISIYNNDIEVYRSRILFHSMMLFFLTFA